MTGQYEIEQYEVNGETRYTINRFDKGGEAHDLNAEGEPVTTLAELRAWICELEESDGFSEVVDGGWVRRSHIAEELLAEVERMEATA